MSSSSYSSFSETNPFPRSVRWIRTLLWEGLVSPLNLRVGEYTNCHPKLVNDINSTLTFVLTRSDPDTLTLSCIRNVTGRDPLDDNCYIKLYISYCNFDERERPGIMSLHQNTIDLDYDIQSYRRLDSKHYETLVKCIVKVVEMENTTNSEREIQEEELFLMIREVSASPAELSEMAYVLRRHDLDDVYTGRMNTSSASIMSALIANACQFSDHIYEYIRARDTSDPRIPNIRLTEILSRICQPREFNEYECTVLFRLAHRFGLEFLRVLCSAWFIENLNDNSVLDTIVLASGTQDSELFQPAAKYFIRRRSKIESSAKWAVLVQQYEGCVETILRSIHYRRTTGDWSFPPLPEHEVGEM